jgi:hypothetical protein
MGELRSAGLSAHVVDEFQRARDVASKICPWVFQEEPEMEAPVDEDYNGEYCYQCGDGGEGEQGQLVICGGADEFSDEDEWRCKFVVHAGCEGIDLNGDVSKIDWFCRRCKERKFQRERIVRLQLQGSDNKHLRFLRDKFPVDLSDTGAQPEGLRGIGIGMSRVEGEGGYGVGSFGSGDISSMQKEIVFEVPNFEKIPRSYGIGMLCGPSGWFWHAGSCA